MSLGYAIAMKNEKYANYLYVLSWLLYGITLTHGLFTFKIVGERWIVAEKARDLADLREKSFTSVMVFKHCIGVMLLHGQSI